MRKLTEKEPVIYLCYAAIQRKLDYSLPIEYAYEAQLYSPLRHTPVTLTRIFQLLRVLLSRQEISNNDMPEICQNI